MRTYKFRAYHPVFGLGYNEEISFLTETVSHKHNSSDKEHIHLADLFRQAERDGVFVMQSTGIKDKSGKEIYEGDILSRVDSGDETDPNYFVVEWNEKNACYVANGVKIPEIGLFSFGASLMEFSNVVGNIYENKELLEEKNGK